MAKAINYNKYCKYKKKMCAHYKTSLDATLAMLRIQRISDKEEVPCRIYKCKCGSYHLTHTKERDHGTDESSKDLVFADNTFSFE